MFCFLEILPVLAALFGTENSRLACFFQFVCETDCTLIVSFSTMTMSGLWYVKLAPLCFHKPTQIQAAWLRGTLVMTRPTGKIPYKNLSTNLYLAFCSSQYKREVLFMYQHLFTANHPYNKFSTYKFYLDKTLSLNITFLELYIQHTAKLLHMSPCWFGYLSVRSKLSDYESYILYCGRLASVSCYSVSHDVKMMLKTSVFVTVRAEMFYSVLDANTLRSTRTGSAEAKTFQAHLVFIIPKNKMELSIFKFRTDPTKRIVAFCPNIRHTNMEAFDGPGTKSKHLTARRGSKSQYFFASSNFQMTIYFFRQMGDSLVLSHISLQKISTDIGVADCGLNLSLPHFSSCIDKLFCFITLNTSTGQKFNLTLKHFQYQGDRNLDECQYAGIWLADHNINTTKVHLKEIYSDCVKEYHSDSSVHDCFMDRAHFYTAYNVSTTNQSFPEPNHSVSVFSRTNKVSIVFYSFQEYGLLSLQIQVSLIQCEVIHGDICQLESLQDNLNPSSIFSVEKPDLFYLLYIYTGKTLFLTGKQKCIVFQLHAYKFATVEDSRRICQLHIYFPDTQATDKQVSMFASGYMQGEWRVCFDFQTMSLNNKILLS